MSGLILPRRYVQMKKPIVFWWNKSADLIMIPPSPIAPPPAGFEKIECRHAHEVDSWSARLRLQEKRLHEMTELERFEYEGKLYSAIIEEMKKCYRNAVDQTNKEFLAHFIRLAEDKREKEKARVIETFMHCEASDGVAS